MEIRDWKEMVDGSHADEGGECGGCWCCTDVQGNRKFVLLILGLAQLCLTRRVSRVAFVRSWLRFFDSVEHLTSQ